MVLEKGRIVRDIETTPETLRELETFFAGEPAATSLTPADDPGETGE